MVVGGDGGGVVAVGFVGAVNAIELVMVVDGLVFVDGSVIVGGWCLLIEGRGDFGCDFGAVGAVSVVGVVCVEFVVIGNGFAIRILPVCCVCVFL